MALTPEERRRIYEEEKAREEAQDQLKKERMAKITSGTQKGCMGCLVVLGAFILIGIFADKFDIGKPPPRQKSAGELKTERNHGPAPDKYEFQASIKQHLKRLSKDPGSVKIYQFGEMKWSDDGWIMSADWGAKNSYGAMVRDFNWFVISRGKIWMKSERAYK